MSINNLNLIVEKSEDVLKGKKDKLKLVICNMVAKGHTLLEDAPGVGKTTLVKFLGKTLGLQVSRIQFTNDLLPADIIGSPVFNRDKQSFDFHQGPIFGELILADELNRAPPKTQSALLQVMEERMITVDGNNYQLPEYFTVIATQNPHMQVGTFDLPESQLDRFSMKLEMGYPDKKSTLELLKIQNRELALDDIQTIMEPTELVMHQNNASQIKVDDSLFDLVYRILDWTRTNQELIPLSNRCGIDIINVSKAWAYLAGRDYLIPDDIHFVFPFVAGHRLVHPENSDVNFEHKLSHDILQQI